ncbi:MAG: hypothetical protein E7252_05200 [Lachnospira sp.]|nr:hypothetical protein [Lachnospira sp.]
MKKTKSIDDKKYLILYIISIIFLFGSLFLIAQLSYTDDARENKLMNFLVVGFVLAAIAIFCIVLVFLADWTKVNISEGFSYVIYLGSYVEFLIHLICAFTQYENVIRVMLIYVIIMAVLLGVEFKKKGNKKLAPIFIQTILMFYIIRPIVRYYYIEVQPHMTVFMLIYILPLLLIGIFRKNNLLKYSMLLQLFVCFIWNIV